VLQRLLAMNAESRLGLVAVQERSDVLAREDQRFPFVVLRTTPIPIVRGVFLVSRLSALGSCAMFVPSADSP